MDLTPVARTIFAKDIYATKVTGINIEYVDENRTVCSMELTDIHLNAKGFVMGGAIFTLADFAFAIAANSDIMASGQDAELQWVSSSSTIHFLSPAKDSPLRATTTKIKQGRNQALIQISVTDSSDRQIALVTTSGTRINSNQN